MTSDNTYEYEDPSSPGILFSVFDEMRETGEHCDVTIKAGDKSFSAHRVILAGRIPYFREALRNMAESTNGEITLEDVDPTTLECFLDFVYTGNLHITDTNVETLLRNAIQLRFESAVDECFRFLLSGLKYSNLVLIRRYANMDNHWNMIENVDRYLRENFEDFTESQAFLSMDYSMLKEMLERDDLQVINEEFVFEAALKWVKANEKERLDHLDDLLFCIRVPLLSTQYLTKRLCNEKILQSSAACRNILQGHSTTEETLSYNCFNSSERNCKEKHHLKCAKLMGNSLYYAGIPDESDTVFVQYYDCVNNKWVMLHDNVLQQFRFVENIYMVSTEENLYFITPDSMVTICLKTLELSSTEHKLDLPSRSKVTLWNGEVYFFAEENDVRGGSSIWCLSLQGYTFKQVGIMEVARTHHGVVSLGEYIYITGGRNIALDRDDDGAFLTSVEKFDPVIGDGAEIEPMLVGRYGHGCAALDGKIYVCGGRVKFWHDPQHYFSCEMYDPSTDEWNFVVSLSIGGYASLIPYGGKLYAFCVNYADAFPFGLLEAEVFSPSDNKWEQAGDVVKVPDMQIKAIIVTNAATSIRSFISI